MRRTSRHILFKGGLLGNWARTPLSGRTAYAEMRRLLDDLGIEGQPTDAEITNRLRGRTYVSGEQWMMSAKAWIMGDLEALKAIHAEPDPYRIKAIGRSIRPFDEKRWKTARVAAVTGGCVAKFTSTDRMKREILDTGDLVIVEASAQDRVWGIGIDWRDQDADAPSKWRGLNLLGECLMSARTIIADRY
jgi:ribA/ribD-fused uncharacterized protein